MIASDGQFSKRECDGQELIRKYSLFHITPFGWSISLHHIDIGIDHVYCLSQRKLAVMMHAESLNVLV